MDDIYFKITSSSNLWSLVFFTKEHKDIILWVFPVYFTKIPRKHIEKFSRFPNKVGLPVLPTQKKTVFIKKNRKLLIHV